MKTYIPRPGDVAMDLVRCYEISMVTGSFEDESFNKFYQHALSDLKKTENSVNQKLLKNVFKCLSRTDDRNLSLFKRQEDLLTASNMLLHSKTR